MMKTKTPPRPPKPRKRPPSTRARTQPVPKPPPAPSPPLPPRPAPQRTTAAEHILDVQRRLYARLVRDLFSPHHHLRVEAAQAIEQHVPALRPLLADPTIRALLRPPPATPSAPLGHPTQPGPKHGRHHPDDNDDDAPGTSRPSHDDYPEEDDDEQDDHDNSGAANDDHHHQPTYQPPHASPHRAYSAAAAPPGLYDGSPGVFEPRRCATPVICRNQAAICTPECPAYSRCPPL